MRVVLTHAAACVPVSAYLAHAGLHSPHAERALGVLYGRLANGTPAVRVCMFAIQRRTP